MRTSGDLSSLGRLRETYLKLRDNISFNCLGPFSDMFFIVASLLIQGSHCRVSTQDIIKENLTKIQAWNKEGGSDTKFAPNQFVVYTEEETKRLLGIQEVEVNFSWVVDSKSDRELEQGPPPSFDWRWFGAVTTPRFSAVQSPFLEAAINTIESAYFR